MIHFTTISRNHREFNLLAVGSLAFKMYSRFLLEGNVHNCSQTTLNVDSVSKLPTLDAHKNNFYVVLISDLDFPELYPLCDYLMNARVNFGYTVGEVMALDDTPQYKKKIHKLKNSFDVLFELDQFLLIESCELSHKEKHGFLCTNFTLQLLHVMKNLCHTEFSSDDRDQPKPLLPYKFGSRTSTGNNLYQI